MRAVVHTSYGPPEVLRLEEIPRLVPKDDEVLVKVHATTVNRTDTGFRQGKPFIVRFFSGLRRPKRVVLGTELAGEIEAVGAAVTEFQVGDSVFGVNADRFGPMPSTCAWHSARRWR
jgi:NADPH:quinone reductase-like Zn-dependent oxidoreductase